MEIIKKIKIVKIENTIYILNQEVLKFFGKVYNVYLH